MPLPSSSFVRFYLQRITEWVGSGMQMAMHLAMHMHHGISDIRFYIFNHRKSAVSTILQICKESYSRGWRTKRWEALRSLARMTSILTMTAQTMFM